MTNFDIRKILMNYICVNEKIFPIYWYCVLIYIWCEALKIWAVCRSHCSISGIYWHPSNSGKIFTLQENIIRIVAGAQPRTLCRSLYTQLTIEDEIRNIGRSWNEVKGIAEDRNAWKLFVDALWSTRSKRNWWCIHN
jgi:hypothetical protein